MADNIYWYEPQMVLDGVVPSILGIGDSWFWYPLPGGSLANSLAKLVAANQHTMLVFGNNGAEAFDYVNGVYAAAVDRALVRYGTGCRRFSFPAAATISPDSTTCGRSSASTAARA